MYEDSNVVELKVYCGCKAKIKVKVVRQVGLNAMEKFSCPNCGIQHFIKASLPIRNSDMVVLSGL